VAVGLLRLVILRPPGIVIATMGSSTTLVPVVTVGLLRLTGIMVAICTSTVATLPRRTRAAALPALALGAAENKKEPLWLVFDYYFGHK